MSQKQRDTCDAWEIKSDDVTISEELGQGAFGKVHKGIMKVPSLKKKGLKLTTAVAVKILQGMLHRVMVWMMIKPGYRRELVVLATSHLKTTLNAFNT